MKASQSAASKPSPFTATDGNFSLRGKNVDGRIRKKTTVPVLSMRLSFLRQRVGKYGRNALWKLSRYYDDRSLSDGVIECGRAFPIQKLLCEPHKRPGFSRLSSPKFARAFGRRVLNFVRDICRLCGSGLKRPFFLSSET